MKHEMASINKFESVQIKQENELSIVNEIDPIDFMDRLIPYEPEELNAVQNPSGSSNMTPRYNKCDICGKTFAFKRYLTQHTKRAHSEKISLKIYSKNRDRNCRRSAPYYNPPRSTKFISIPTSEYIHLKQQVEENNRMLRATNMKLDLISQKLENLSKPINCDCGHKTGVAVQNILDDFVPCNDTKFMLMTEEKLCFYDRAPGLDKELKEMRVKMVNHFSRIIKNSKPGSDPKNGYMHCTLTNYFTEDLFRKLGWSQTKDRVEFRSCTGHITLFMDIINKAYPGTYENLEQAVKAARTIIQREMWNNKSVKSVANNIEVQVKNIFKESKIFEL